MIRLTFKPARPAPVSQYLRKTLAQAAAFWGVFLLVIPWLIYEAENALGVGHFAFPGQNAWAWTGFAAASCLGVWSGVTMAVAGKGTPFPTETARDLVRSGPYRFVRNPMAVAGLGQGAFVGLALGSLGIMVYVLTGMVLWNLLVRPIEEADLRARFGDAFVQYARSVPCWLPALRVSTFPKQEEALPRESDATSRTGSIILFDGVCNLCNASVRFVIDRDPTERFRFASQQSEAGRKLLERHRLDPDRDDTIVLIEDDRAYVRSTAALRIARRLNWPWPLLYGTIVIPRFLRDWAYARVAANRYRWFGKSEACPLYQDGPDKDRFLPEESQEPSQ